MLRENARTAGVTNIKPVRSTQENTGLPKEAVDLILMVDVYHECSDPEAILQGMKARSSRKAGWSSSNSAAKTPRSPSSPSTR